MRKIVQKQYDDVCRKQKYICNIDDLIKCFVGHSCKIILQLKEKYNQKNIMEDFMHKMSYMNHLKKIADIRNKSPYKHLDFYTSRLNYSYKLNHLCRNDSEKVYRGSKTAKKLHRKPNLLMQFLKDKENKRLVRELSTIESDITMKKYEENYNTLKHTIQMRKKSKSPMLAKTIYCFKIHDICFQNHHENPDQIFSISVLNNGKWQLLIEGDRYQLRKQGIYISKSQQYKLKIVGKNCQGIAKVKGNNSSIFPILRKKQYIGNLILEPYQ